jgi:hypothetical protein
MALNHCRKRGNVGSLASLWRYGGVRSGPSLHPAVALMDSKQRLLARWRPELFAYQLVVEAEPS